MYMHLCVCIYSTKQVYYYTKCVCVYLRILPLLRKKTSKRRPKIWDPTPLKIARQYSRSEPRAGREVGSFSRERERDCACVCVRVSVCVRSERKWREVMGNLVEE